MLGKIVLGMSGGVDSATAACMLRDMGYQVHGLFLRYGQSDPQPAIRAAKELDIPLEVADITDILEQKVICPFIEGYLSGCTPNPCIVCNPGVKFRALVEMADRIGAEKIATGHYARVRGGKLYSSPSPKDQSYMLYRLPPEVITRCLFPLGDTEDKEAVRAFARKAGLSSGDAPDSMEICFVPQAEHGDFIESRGKRGKEGNFVDEQGNILGRHLGIHRYTVGQRRGLGIAASGRLYVKSIDAAGGDITLSLNDPKSLKAYIKDITFAAPEYSGKESFDCLVRVRHSKGFFAGRCLPQKGVIEFESPVRALSPGQSAVCYSEDGLVIGGGFIVGAE